LHLEGFIRLTILSWTARSGEWAVWGLYCNTCVCQGLTKTVCHSMSRDFYAFSYRLNNALKQMTKLCLPVLSALDVDVIPEVSDAAVSVVCVTVCKNTHS